MNLTPYLLPADIQAVLLQAQQAGVMVDFAFYNLPTEPAQEMELHCQAALAGERVFTSWADEVRHLWPENLKQRDWPATKPERMHSTLVSMIEFLGQSPWSGEWGSHGFRYAFLEPPYGLACTRQVAEQLCLTLTNYLTAGNPQILSWSDDWSGYFDAGKEGWGTFFWTLLNPTHGCVAAIGASTTD